MKRSRENKYVPHGKTAHPDSTRIQLQMPRESYERLQRRAKDLGFGSVQGYLRFLIKAELEGRKVHHGELHGPDGILKRRWNKRLIEAYRQEGFPVPAELPTSRQVSNTLFTEDLDDPNESLASD